MKPKTSLVPKATKKVKSAPDATVYLTKKGERVRITKSKEFPTVQAGDPAWMKKLREQGNERPVVVRISDGHELWGVDINTLVVEKPPLKRKKKVEVQMRREITFGIQMGD